MTHLRICTLVLLPLMLALTFATNSNGQESTTEPLPPPNPFGQMMQSLNPANWRMPKLKMPTMKNFMPTKKEKDRVITKKDSLVTEVSETTKNTWRRTKETLNPMRLIPAGFKQDPETRPAPKKQGGFFSNLFAPRQPEPEQAQSVTDWLKQDPVR
jgi:hypothetical protein